MCWGTFSYNGQRCTALKILFVHEQIVEAFLAHLTNAVQFLTVGMPWDKDVQLPPLPEPEKPTYLTELLADAQQRGARIVNPHGGTVQHTFFYPALVYPVNAQMRLYREEQFGPVIPIAAFHDIETPIRYIVESNYAAQVESHDKADTKIGAQIVIRISATG